MTAQDLMRVLVELPPNTVITIDMDDFRGTNFRNVTGYTVYKSINGGTCLGLNDDIQNDKVKT